MRGLGLTHPPDSILAPELVGVILVEDYSKELDELTRAAAGSITQAAVAGQQSNCFIMADDGAEFFVLDRIIVRADITTDISVIVPNVLLAPLTTAKGQYRDLALIGRPQAEMGAFTGAAPAGIRVHQLQIQPTVLGVNILDVDYTLRLRTNETQAPICISTAQQQVALAVSFDWREFSVPPIG